MSELGNTDQFDNEPFDVDPDVYLGRLQARVYSKIASQEAAELPPEDYKQKLKKNVFGSDEENLQNALDFKRTTEGKKFTKQKEKEYIAEYKKKNPSLEKRIDSGVDALHNSISFLQGQPKVSSYMKYINVPELLAVMCKETSMDADAEGKDGEKSYFHLTKERRTDITNWTVDNKIYIPSFINETVLGLLSFLKYKKDSLERFAQIKTPKLADREKNKLVWLAHNKGIENTEKIVSLSYASFLAQKRTNPSVVRSFDFVYKTLYTMAGFDEKTYTPKRMKNKQQSTQFLKLSVIDYGTVAETEIIPLSSAYPLNPYRASVGLRYMLTIEALIEQLK